MRNCLLLLLTLFSLQSFAQEQIWQVNLTDKGPESELQLQLPQQFLSPRALERRQRQGIPLSTQDLPVCPDYLEAIHSRFKTVAVSKWLNAVWISSASDPTAQLLQFSFVASVQPWKGRPTVPAAVQLDGRAYGSSQHQAEMLNLPPLHNKGITGKGVLIAVMDGGFSKVDSLNAFVSIRPRIRSVRDFVDGDNYPYHSSNHGTMVLSTIGLAWQDTLIGTAPEADFLLARTEDVNSETPIEELNYQMAAEWADSAGADIIHASLGYSVFDTGNESYVYADMDGNNTIITRAAETAFSKGIFVVNSAGNEGWGPWFKITAPCDGEHVLCVGALEPTRTLARFSSLGPSYDGRVKPDVVALGAQASAVDDSGNPVVANGTSFSAPMVAGMAACLIQSHPEASNTSLLSAIRRSAHQYHHPDTLQGFGIPNALKADSLLSVTSSFPVCGEEELSIFPNPAGQEVQLKSKYTLKGAQLEIFDAAGVRWLEETISFNLQVKMIDTAQLPSGVYYVRLQRDEDACVLSLLVR